MPLTERFVHQPAADFREVKIETGEDAHQHAAKQHIMEVGDDDVAVGLLEIDRSARVHNATKAADRKLEDKPERE